MLRKTLTTLSLIGLLLSVGAWLLSYHGRPAVRSSEYFAALSSGRFTYVTEYLIGPYWEYDQETEESGNFRWGYRHIRTWSWAPLVDWHLGFGFHLPLYLPSVLFAAPFIWKGCRWYRESLIQQRHLRLFKSMPIITCALAFAILLTGIVKDREYGMMVLAVLAVSFSLIFGRKWVREARERGLYLHSLVFVIMLTRIARDREDGMMALAMFVVSISLIMGLEWVRERKEGGICLRCAYDLRGSKDRCPECGQEFDRSCFEKP